MAKKETTKPKNDREIDDYIPLRFACEERVGMGLVRDREPYRDPTPAVEARLKKMVERLEAKKKKAVKS